MFSQPCKILENSRVVTEAAESRPSNVERRFRSFAHPTGLHVKAVGGSAEEQHGRMGQCSGMSPDAAWAEADELRVAERSTLESNTDVRPDEAAERGVMRCRST